LERLALDLGYGSLAEAASILALQGVVQDGAHIIASDGRVLGASLQLALESSVEDALQLVKVNKQGAGTRHATGLTAAQWLGKAGIAGAVIVRSDAGGCHFMFPVTAGDPEVFYVPSGAGA